MSRRQRRAHHAADPRRSDRLRRLLRALRVGEASSLQLIRRAGIVALSAAIDELRKRGHRIDCSRSGGVWRYRLARA